VRTFSEHASSGPRLQLASLRKWQILRATRPACGHRGGIDIAALRRRRGGDMPVQRIEHRLRCTACGNAAGNALELGCYPRNFDP